jgi:hypothetical protein
MGELRFRVDPDALAVCGIEDIAATALAAC